MKKFKVSLLQLDVKFGDPEANYSNVEKYIEEAVHDKPDVLVLPEMWNTGYDLERLETIADKDGQRTKALLTRLAKHFAVNIVGGSVATKEDGKFYNTSYIFDRKGQLISQYQKVHLFGLMSEDDFISAGSTLNQFIIDGIKAAGVICYDIRFPEWERKLMSTGQQILFVSAQWPTKRIEQWKMLLCARAIENQSFVVAVNRVGNAPKDSFNGHSLVIDPLGKILEEGATDVEGIFTCEFDLDDLKAVRGNIPVFDDRRPDLYF
ncbi:MAG: carbon-nitrogen family hydrolase [Liquorilactobacillus hordei]|mgnify:FL=1|uniref:carbon-nitrogen family hydrolase n=1 Tax=Liquorilactobacillus hordei TaxID=468911 RepID=UPI001CC078CD|nr:carbon-nitrogen family hydrolase [Liquorilactobacillus hordei]MBZ2406466.1 carbon-nitrogen hydrolase [Liquorilactobacillus hordei]